MTNPAYLEQDPFPSIPPALLNSADINDYVRATGMIEPFSLGKLKPASYEADLLGQVYSWRKGASTPTVQHIEKDRKIRVKKNSIVFVYLATKFKLPSYIALRFNLKISLVHRGLLLGTGPLIDPGFEGRLLIPLHNLTSEDCELIGGEGLIWIEFTKLSGSQKWGGDVSSRANDLESRFGIYREFPKDKKNILAESYFFKASPHAPIMSSIPDLLDQAEKLSRDSEKLLNQARNIGIVAGITLLIALIAMFYQVFGLISDSNGYVNALRKDMDVTERNLNVQQRLMRETDERTKALAADLATLKKKR